MAITQGQTTTFKEELLLGGHDFSTSGASAGAFAVSLHNVSSNTFDGSISQYVSTDEVASSGDPANNGYVAGGYSANQALTVNTAPTNGGSGTTVFTSFADKTFTAVSFTANCGLIYNNSPAGNASSRTNPSVGIMDFGGAKVVSNGDFTLQFPAAAASTAIIRIA